MSNQKAPTYFKEHLWTAEIPKELSNSYLDSHDQKLPRVIYPDIRVLTANKGTQNDTYYPEESLRGNAEKGTGLITFNRPYAVPILRDHLDTPSAQGGYSSEVYGRVYHPAQIHANGGEKYLRCMATITHPEAIEAILTGRWLTVSLGSKTDSVKCSICKGELTEGLCDHQKGKMYETNDSPDHREKCRWVIGPIRAREISFVVSPSDDQAGILNPNLKEGCMATCELAIAIPRLLIGDDKGIFDLTTGVEVKESEIFARPSNSKIFGGLTTLTPTPRFRQLGSETGIKVHKESKSSKKPKRLNPLEPATEAQVKEDFIGPGKYLLSGWDHDHTVVLDQRGDGTSSPSQMPPTQFQSPGYMYPTMSAEAITGVGGGPSKGRGMGDGDNTRPDPAPVQTGDQEDHTHEVLGGRVMKAGYPTHSHDLEPAHAALETSLMPDKKTTEATDGASTTNDVEQTTQLPSGHSEADKKSEFAAKLVDTEHKIEFGLYSLPNNHDETEVLLDKIKSMPHTPSEKEGILSRVAAHCKDILPMSSWQHFFGELTSCESGDPIVLTINSENYGMLYTLSSVVAKPVEVENNTTKVEETEKKEEDANKDSADTKESETESGLPIIPQKRTEESSDIATTTESDPASDIVRETIKSLQAKLSETEGTAKYALAHSCAIYMKALKKPLSRDKTSQELIETLSKRSTSSLRDTLDDLLSELDASGVLLTKTGETPSVPKLTDPTDAKSVVGKIPASSTGSEAVITDEAALEEMKKSTLEKTAESMGKGKFSALFTNEGEEDEEEFTVLGSMFGDLKVRQKDSKKK